MISLNKMLTAAKLAWDILELEERTQELWSQDKCARRLAGGLWAHIVEIARNYESKAYPR
jgi:hypothetical protein